MVKRKKKKKKKKKRRKITLQKENTRWVLAQTFQTTAD